MRRNLEAIKIDWLWAVTVRVVTWQPQLRCLLETTEAHTYVFNC